MLGGEAAAEAKSTLGKKVGIAGERNFVGWKLHA